MLSHSVAGYCRKGFCATLLQIESCDNVAHLSHSVTKKENIKYLGRSLKNENRISTFQCPATFCENERYYENRFLLPCILIHHACNPWLCSANALQYFTSTENPGSSPK